MSVQNEWFSLLSQRVSKAKLPSIWTDEPTWTSKKKKMKIIAGHTREKCWWHQFHYYLQIAALHWSRRRITDVGFVKTQKRSYLSEDHTITRNAIEWITGRCTLIPPGLTDFIVVSTFFFRILKMFFDFHETHKWWDDNHWEQNQKNNLIKGNKNANFHNGKRADN